MEYFAKFVDRSQDDLEPRNKNELLLVVRENEWYLNTTISGSFHDCQRVLDSMPLPLLVQLVTSFDLT